MITILPSVGALQRKAFCGIRVGTFTEPVWRDKWGRIRFGPYIADEGEKGTLEVDHIEYIALASSVHLKFCNDFTLDDWGDGVVQVGKP